MKDLEQKLITPTQRKTPYVVSSDVAGLMGRWTAQEGLQSPKNDLFKALSGELHTTIERYFPDGVEFVDEEELRTGMQARIKNSPHPAVSLDRAYVTSKTPNVEGFIDLTRGVDENLQSIGLRERPGTPSKSTQLELLRMPQVTPITLVDDVIFSGHCLVEIAKDFAEVNRRVEKVITGIGISEGIELVEAHGIEVDAVKTFAEVVDEVCARDFYPGIPMSGRSVYASDGNYYSAPYINPFGDAREWASIPREYVEEFSQVALQHSATIWQATEKESDIKIPSTRVPRQVRGLEDATSFASALKRYIR